MLFLKRQPVAWLVAGLGNPGLRYENTRHNAGFMAIDRLAADCGVSIERLKYKAKTAEAEIGGVRCLLMKPETFMNLSGQAVAEAARFYKIPPAHILVFSDDIALEPGKIRIRRKGSAGGQRGLQSIIDELGSEDFPRIRLGIGAKPHPDYDLADWVLSRFSKAELAVMEKAAARAAEAAVPVIAGKIDEAMNRYQG